MTLTADPTPKLGRAGAIDGRCAVIAASAGEWAEANGMVVPFPRVADNDATAQTRMDCWDAYAQTGATTRCGAARRWRRCGTDDQGRWLRGGG